MKSLFCVCLLMLFWIPLSACTVQETEPPDIALNTPSLDADEAETFISLTTAEIREIGLSCGQQDFGYGWDVFHGDRSRWFQTTGDQPPTEWFGSPLTSDAVYYYLDETGEMPVEEVAGILVDKLLASMLEDDPELRQFTVLDYRVKEQEPQTRAQAVETFVDDTIRLAPEMLAEMERSELEDYFSYWLGAVYPGLDQDMWVFTPNFSFSWSGMAGVLGFDPDAAGEDGLIVVRKTVAHSPEADFHILVKYGDWYRLQNMERMVEAASAGQSAPS